MPHLFNPVKKLLFPVIHVMVVFARLHVCGKITHLLPGITDPGIDILDIDHIVDAATAKNALENAVVMTMHNNILSSSYLMACNLLY